MEGHGIATPRRIDSPLCAMNPSPPGFAYDELNRRIFVFGGRGASGTLGDTWMYTFADQLWTQFTPATSPPPRHSMLAGYHSTAGRTFSLTTDPILGGDVFLGELMAGI